MMLQEVTAAIAKGYLNAAAASAATGGSRRKSAKIRSGVVFGFKQGAVCGLGFVYSSRRGNCGGVGGGSSNSSMRLLSASCVSLRDALYPSLALLASCCR